MTMNDFKIYVPIQKSNLNLDDDGFIQLNPDGTLDIEGIASTTNVDLQKDIILPSAIESMKKQLQSRTINLHGDHNYSLGGVLGAINKVFDSNPNELHIGCRILKKHAPMVKEMLENNIALGYSIGGKPTSYTKNDVGGYGVKDLNLYEISLTPFPANRDTLGTVRVAKNGTVEGTCLAGVCNKIMKSIYFEEEDNMTDNNNNNNDSTNEQIENKIKATVDELWAEKQQGLIDSLKNTFKQEIKDTVEEILENKNKEPEEESEEEPEDVTKSFNMDEFTENMKKSMEETFGEFKKQFFGDLDNNRNPSSQVNLKKQLEEEKPEVKKTWSSNEIAEMLMKRQGTKDPIMNAVMSNLQ